MNSRAPLLAVILAAGDSRRFGSDKRRARTAAGASLLEASLAALDGHVGAVYVAIRPDDVINSSWPDSLPATAVHYVSAPRSAQGMGCSLADTVRQLPPDCDVLVALADMPFIRSETIAQLVQRYRQSTLDAPIAYPYCVSPAQKGETAANPAGKAPRRGHPVIFHRAYRAELEALQGDQGANRIIAAHPAMHEGLEVQDPGVLLDVDQPSDLRNG